MYLYVDSISKKSLVDEFQINLTTPFIEKTK